MSRSIERNATINANKESGVNRAASSLALFHSLEHYANRMKYSLLGLKHGDSALRGPREFESCFV
jgi:hypothetical protein